jgi:Small subunit of serine palmitoyltransferase-like
MVPKILIRFKVLPIRTNMVNSIFPTYISCKKKRTGMTIGISSIRICRCITWESRLHPTLGPVFYIKKERLSSFYWADYGRLQFSAGGMRWRSQPPGPPWEVTVLHVGFVPQPVIGFLSPVTMSSQSQYTYRPPKSALGAFLWRRQIWFEATFALSMLEPWEKVLVGA